MIKEIIRKRMNESVDIKKSMIANEQIIELLEKLSIDMAECLKAGRKFVICGNGGSASDALHFAGEVVGRFQKERLPWPAVVLNADVAVITAIANDYGYNEVFSRQAEAHLQQQDFFIGISTSGNSENILYAVDVAKRKGAKTVALLGRDGGRIGTKVDYPVIVPSNITARIQESHIMIIHILCELIEEMMG